jgi:hypothetical protein
MPSLRPHLSSIVVAASLMVALFAATAGPPAVAAAKPSIRGVSIHSREFIPIRAIVFGAARVVICVSRVCTTAIRQSQPGLWTTLGGRVDIRKGQTREVIVFAASSTGEVSYLVTRVLVQ